MGQEEARMGSPRVHWLRSRLHEAPARRGGRGRDCRDWQEEDGR